MNINPEKIIELDHNNIILWKDTNSKLLGCNVKYAEMTGITLQQVIGLTDYDLSFTSKEAEGFVGGDKKVLATKITQQYHEVATFICGKKELQTIKIPVFNAMGKIISIIITGYIVNITNKHSENSCFHINGEKISKSEMKILSLLVRGKTAKEMGDALFLSKRTVETYLDRLKNKLNVTTKSQLIDLVFEYYR